jgi:prolipoprotein diacylglyceryl transferase
MFASIDWDPDKNLFIIPYINHPVAWYGLLFAAGFLIGFFLLRKLMTDFLAQSAGSHSDTQLHATLLTDRLFMFAVIGGVLGARLGHVFFYDWSYYRENLGSILKIWEGGLASHGGAAGELIALIAFTFLCRREAKPLTLLALIDLLVIPAAFIGGCIRIGNFINQEITGNPTSLPWGVRFGHPLDGIPGIPVHPVQLYESIFYYFVFLVLLFLWKYKKNVVGSGLFSGWFFFLVFGFRLLIEKIKVPQNLAFDLAHGVTMGQLLSLPFILLGAGLLVRYYAKKNR